jgi:hypothetical protein
MARLSAQRVASRAAHATTPVTSARFLARVRSAGSSFKPLTEGAHDNVQPNAVHRDQHAQETEAFMMQLQRQAKSLPFQHRPWDPAAAADASFLQRQQGAAVPSETAALGFSWLPGLTMGAPTFFAGPMQFGSALMQPPMWATGTHGPGSRGDACARLWLSGAARAAEFAPASVFLGQTLPAGAAMALGFPGQALASSYGVGLAPGQPGAAVAATGPQAFSMPLGGSSLTQDGTAQQHLPFRHPFAPQRQ